MPLPPGRGAGTAPALLAVLNHRGERLGATCAWFQERGWDVRVTTHLAESLELLQRGQPRAVLAYPLTLLREGLEWQMLAPALSPAKPVPWIVAPWPGAPTAALAQLLAGSPALADFIRSGEDWPELEARLSHLLAVQDLMTRTLARAAELEGQLVTDHKTGLANDRHFRERLREEFERSQRHKMPASLILLDLDSFKQINDAHSYEYGDAVLAAVADALRHSVRSIDIPARIGGDEFAIILPSTKPAEAQAVAQRVRATLRETTVGVEVQRLPLTASQGLASAEGGLPRDPRQWFLQANEALKTAKKSGRDQIVVWESRRQGDSSS